MALFSIITVTRNNLEGLKRTYDSLIHQDMQIYEWLVIDGASDDGTVEFLDSVKADYISEPDDGIYDAMNKGIERAEGFFILFLNAGDRLAYKQTLKKLAAYIEELQITPDFIYGDALEGTTQQDAQYKTARPYKKAAWGLFTHHQSMFYRKDKIGNLHYDLNYPIAADYKFTLQYLENCKTIVYAPFPLCLYESGGISQANAAQGRKEQFEIRKELGATPEWKNHTITAIQKAVWVLRKIFPNLYWLLKQGKQSGGDTPPASI